MCEQLELDWKVATEAAAEKISLANPSMLIIVSGLCASYDLRLTLCPHSQIASMPCTV